MPQTDQARSTSSAPGTEGFDQLEDSLLAGAFAQHFDDLGGTLENDEAEIVAGALANDRGRDRGLAAARRSGTWSSDPAGPLPGRGPGRPARDPSSGSTTDIEAAAELNRFDRSSPSCAATRCGSWRSEP